MYAIILYSKDSKSQEVMISLTLVSESNWVKIFLQFSGLRELQRWIWHDFCVSKYGIRNLGMEW